MLTQYDENGRGRLLVLANPDIQRMIRYEGIEFISKYEEIEPTWRKNKTPIILKGELTPKIKREYKLLNVPNPYIDSECFEAFCHFNGIECGELMREMVYDTSTEECFLCMIAGHGGYKSATAFNLKVINTCRIHDLIIYESHNFYVKIELGCLKEGMLMINPKKHFLSAAQLPNELVEEYELIKRDVEFLLKGAFGDAPVLFFEHGSAPSGLSSHQRSIVHAHTHVAWGVKFPQKYKDMVALKPRDIRTLANSKYLSYQEGADGEFLAVDDPNVYVQRQYPRQVIAKLEGIPNELSNWRKEPFTQKMQNTFNGLYNYLITNQDFISSRIIKATKPFVAAYSKKMK